MMEFNENVQEQERQRVREKWNAEKNGRKTILFGFANLEEKK